MRFFMAFVNMGFHPPLLEGISEFHPEKSTRGISGHVSIVFINQIFHHVGVFIYEVRENGEIVVVDDGMDFLSERRQDFFNRFFGIPNVLSRLDRMSFKIDKKEIFCWISYER